MDWFSILKEQRQVARNVQSFKPIQLDKPIKLNKPEKSCYEKLLDYCSEHGQRRDSDDGWNYVFEKYRSNIYIPKDKKLSDEIYCYALEEFKKFMEIPKEEIKASEFSTKGLTIFTAVRDGMANTVIRYIISNSDEVIIDYIYI